MKNINKKLFETVEELKKKRMPEKPLQNLDLKHSASYSPDSYMYKEKQKEFNEKRKVALAQAHNRKENIEVEEHRQKLFIANKKDIEKNIQIELRAIKIVRLWEQKRKARFIKLITLKKVIFALGRNYTFERNLWLQNGKEHLATFRIQKAWKQLTILRNPLLKNRTKILIQNTFKTTFGLCKSAKVDQNARLVLKSFLENISGKINVNEAFTSWYKKVETIQQFLRTGYHRKQERVRVMKVYWNRITDVADWNILMANNSDKKLKKIRQYELTKLSKMNDMRKEAIIHEYLKGYTFDRYNNLIQFNIIINDLPRSLKTLAMFKFYIGKLQNDDLTKFKRDPEIVDRIVSAGFEDLFSVKKNKNVAKPKAVKATKNRAGSKNSKKRIEIKESDEGLSKEEKAVKETMDALNVKLYGLIVPKAGNFLPDFFDMIKLMTLKF